MESKMQGKRERMKWSKEHEDRFTTSYTKTGRKNKYQCELNYNSYYNIYYFTIRKDNYFFNSYCSNMKYRTEEECAEFCEMKVNELTKGERK